MDKDLLEQMTDLLMEHGCTVNKAAMVKLLDFVTAREQGICRSYIRTSEKKIERIGYELLKYAPHVDN